MSVEYIRPEVKAKQPAWRMVRDCVAGSEAVKAGGYAMPVNSHDTSDANRERNRERVKGAFFFNATGRTLQALVGIAFGKWPEVKLPGALEYLKQDVNGSGVGLINQAQGVVGEVLQTARAGLLTTYPRSAGVASRAEMAEQALRPSIQMYEADSIINWRTERVGARNLLTLVVLKEQHEIPGEFELEFETQYRVLRLVEGRYVHQVWRKPKGESEYKVAEEYLPTDGAGNPWREIPFAFVGATNNDPAPDSPPLYDLADANIAHFRNSADYEEGLFYAGQPTYWMSGVDPEEALEMQKHGMYVGSRSILPLPAGAQAGLLQQNPVDGLSEAMKHKVELMASLGARLVAPGEVARTATEAAADDKTSHSVLSIIADNTSDAYRKALAWCAQFHNVAGEVDFSLSTEYGQMQFDAQQVTAAMSLVQAGKLPETDLWTYLRSLGLIEATKSDDDIRDELETQGGGGLTLDDLPALMGAANGAAGAR